MKYDKNNPLRVFTSFSGYDSQCMSLDRLKQNFTDFDYELVGWSEIDKYAIQAHDAIYPQYADRNYGDISKIEWEKVSDFDLFTYSSPCFIAGTLILTENGYKPIEKVRVGEKVLTHTNRYCSVAKVGNKPSSDIYNIKGMMFDEINCTGNHPFYTREMYRYGHKSKRAFRSPEWIEAANLTKKHYIGYAINQESVLPKWDGVIDRRWGRDSRVNKLQPMFDKSDFWYLMGRYVGDGWKKESNNGRGIIICHSERNKESLYSALDRLGIHYYIQNERTVTKVTICMNELFCFVERYGYYAHGKHIDSETLSLPCNLLQSFIDGMLDSDGCYTNNEYKITTVSKELVYGISQCVAKVYHRHCKVNVFHRKPACVIEGRTVNQRDTYSVSWHIDIRKQDHAFCENGVIWFPISKLQKKNGIDIVYNLEVEEDHSYTANGAIVHNCQDFSQAGKQRGGTKGSGTRSSLLWECEKAIIEKRPKYLLMENVSALVSGKFIKLFNAWQKTLEGYGYKNFGKVLNAKDYGVPQNRERIFLFSIRDDGDNPTFNFPKTIKLEKRLKDILETEVDEKYYLSEKTIQSFSEHCERKQQEGCGFKFEPTQGEGYAKAISTHAGSRHTDNFIAEPVVLGWTRDSEGNVTGRHPVEVANCVTSGKRENTQNYVVEPKIVAMRVREPQVMTPKRTEYGKAIRKQYEAGEIRKSISGERNNYTRIRIRKLSERECFRLMDVPEEYIDIIQKSGVSRSQQYKMAGNSIVVNVLYHIFRKAFIETENENSQLTLF